MNLEFINLGHLLFSSSTVWIFYMNSFNFFFCSSLCPQANLEGGENQIQFSTRRRENKVKLRNSLLFFVNLPVCLDVFFCRSQLSLAHYILLEQFFIEFFFSRRMRPVPSIHLFSQASICAVCISLTITINGNIRYCYC